MLVVCSLSIVRWIPERDYKSIRESIIDCDKSCYGRSNVPAAHKGLQNERVVVSVWKESHLPRQREFSTRNYWCFPSTLVSHTRSLPWRKEKASLSLICPRGEQLWHGVNMLMVSLPQTHLGFTLTHTVQTKTHTEHVWHKNKMLTTTKRTSQHHTNNLPNQVSFSV